MSNKKLWKLKNLWIYFLILEDIQWKNKDKIELGAAHLISNLCKAEVLSALLFPTAAMLNLLHSVGYTQGQAHFEVKGINIWYLALHHVVKQTPRHTIKQIQDGVNNYSLLQSHQLRAAQRAVS